MATAVAPTLYDIEDTLTTMENTLEIVAPDLEQQFLADFQAALMSAADKRDRIAHFLGWLGAQVAFIETETARLRDLKRHYEAVQDKLEGYVLYVIEAQGLDAKGKFKKLEGHTTMLYAQRCPASVEISDPVAVPLDYQTATINMPASSWNDLINVMPELALAPCKLEPAKTAIKRAIEAGEHVDGAKLVTDKLSLRRK